jgi:GNAT superfamily N-acetyltransferase
MRAPTVTSVQVTQLDVADDASVARAYRVGAASSTVGRPWADPESLESFALDVRYVDAGEAHELHGAFVDGELVGQARLWIPLRDNTDKVYADIQVHPEHRRRGAGSALLGRVVEVARQRGRQEVLSEVLAPLDSTVDHPYRRFALRHGFVEASMDSMRHLSLPVADDLLDELDAKARPHWESDYRLETYSNGVPEHLQQSLCDAENRLATDAPAGSVTYEPEALTPERYREHMRLQREQGAHRLTTVAVDRRTGLVAAYTDLVVLGGTRRRVGQWGTLVGPEHRGHRLGMAVKVANLRRLQLDHPERDHVATGNADVNAWMLAINEALGFRLVEICPQLQLRL